MGNLNKVLWCDFRDSLLQGVMWGWRTMDSWMCYTNIGSHAANLYLEGGTSRFIGNHFDGDGDNGAGPEYNVYCGDGCRAMVFEHNIFENTQKENIFFRQPSYSNQTMTITIANNIIRTCSKSQNEQYANIKISGYSESVPATEIVISGNQILNPDTNANHGYAGIHLLYCTNSKVVGNTFFNVGDDEVLLDNTCENVLDDGKMSEELSSLKTDINSKADASDVAELENEIGNKADEPTGTKSTGKVYGLDSNLNPAWIEKDTDPETIAEATAEWLDDHPEATTTVQDGAITLPKLSESLSEVVVISEESDKGYFHNVNPQKITFYPNSLVPNEPCRYVGSENIIGGRYSTGTQGNVVKTKDGAFLKLTGASTTGTVFAQLSDSATLEKIRGKTVNLYMYLKKSTPWEVSSYLKVNDGKSNKATINFAKNSETLIGWTEKTNIEIASDATQILVRLDDGGGVFASGDFIWVGIYVASAVNTEHVFDGDDPYAINVSGINYVDTMLHESVVDHSIPTKKYVDEHTPDIIGYWSENVYAMPEYFGAVGDGVTDDTQAILDCLDYAIENGKAVKGYRKYKTTSTIVLATRGMDVYLKEVIYTGANAAIQISGRNINFGFDKIQSSGSGIGFVYVNSSCTRNNVKGICLDCAGDAIFTDGATYYSTISIREVKSSNGNIIEFTDENGTSGEYVFYDFSCDCPNGWVAYNPISAKFYNFTVEGNCKNGIYSPSRCECYGWRHREFIDRYALRIYDEQSTYENGSLVEFANISDSIVYISCDFIYPFSIDTDSLERNAEYTDASLWWTASNNVTRIMCDVVMPYNAYGGKAMPKIAKEVKVINGCKVFVPMNDLYVDVDSAIFSNRHFDTNVISTIRAATKYMMATEFNVTTDTEIQLSASYNAIGYNKFEVHTNGNDVVIKDSNDNKIFDSGNYQGTDFLLVCVPQYGNKGLYIQSNYDYWVYDGTNHIWKVKEL